MNPTETDLVNKIDWQKVGDLCPAIVQHYISGKVLMLGYMNRQALLKSIECKLVTFYSRTKQRLWTKGETSGNSLTLKSMSLDCDNDTLLVLAQPKGPACHLGTSTCFSDDESPDLAFVYDLAKTIQSRRTATADQSYTRKLFDEGLDRIAQKLGEEAVETVLAAKNDDKNAFLGECADLVYHLLVLIEQKDASLEEVVSVLKKRQRP